MALQLTGAYKRSAIANLQVRLPAVVIGGGLTAIDTATELLAYYVVQVEKTAERFDDPHRRARRGGGAGHVRRGGARVPRRAARATPRPSAPSAQLRRARRGAPPVFQPLLDSWGGVTLVYRKRVIDSPAYRLNHEEVIKSLEEGVRYVENMAPIEAVLDARGAREGDDASSGRRSKDGKWKGNGEIVELPARTVLRRRRHEPQRDLREGEPGLLRARQGKQFFQAAPARRVDDEGKLSRRADRAQPSGFFTSYNDGKHAVSFYGDNHPHYAGSVVKAMASAKDGYPARRGALPPDIAAPRRRAAGRARRAPARPSSPSSTTSSSPSSTR